MDTATKKKEKAKGERGRERERETLIGEVERKEGGNLERNWQPQI